MKILGLDVGDKTIGIAVSDMLGLTAQGLETIRRTSNEADIKRIKEIVEERGITEIVIGLPKNMNGTIGPQGEKVIKFSEKVKKKIDDVNIVFWDERLTTVAAERMLISADVSRKKRKRVIDKVAAVYILQSYLDSKKN